MALGARMTPGGTHGILEHAQQPASAQQVDILRAPDEEANRVKMKHATKMQSA